MSAPLVFEVPRPPPVAVPGEHSSETDHLDWALHREFRAQGVLWGAAAGGVLIGVYVATLGLANSSGHVADEFLRLWYWMTPLVLGFSLQVGLFGYARRAAHAGRGAARSHGVIASSGTSTVSMIACCAHHLTDVLPVIGLAGAATVLASYQSIFLLLGVLSNALGLLYILGHLRRSGLFPERTSILSLTLRWPIEKALRPATAVSLGIFLFVLWRQTS